MSREGGEARARTLSPSRRTEIAREAARVRWSKTYRVRWIFEQTECERCSLRDARVWDKGGLSHAEAIELKELPLKYGLPVRRVEMEPEEKKEKKEKGER